MGAKSKWKLGIVPVVCLTGLLVVPSIGMGAGETDVVTSSQQSGAVAGVGGSTPGSGNPSSQYREGEVIVKFRKGVNRESALQGLASMSFVQVREFRTLSRQKGQVVAVVRKEGRTTEELVRELQALPDVEVVVPNYLRKTQTVPNDPNYQALWGLQKVNAERAWDFTTGSPGVVVADTDTGTDIYHEDLAANLWANTSEIPDNGIDDDMNGYVDDIYGINVLTHDGNVLDDYGHGTHTAGTIAAAGNNGIGITGVTWTTKIMTLKFLDSGGWGSDAGAIESIDYVLDMKSRGVNVVAINASWGGGGYNPLLEEAIAAAGDSGILFIAAAGNYGNDNDSYPFYPASYRLPNIISVAATEYNDNLTWFSNFGATAVHLAAPGESIYSTYPGGSYAHMSGTSMATPHVTGAVALAAAKYPDETMTSRRDRVIAGVDYVPYLEGRMQSAGRLNAANIVDPTIRPIISSVSDFLYAPRIAFTINGRNFGGNAGTVWCTDQYGNSHSVTVSSWSDTKVRVLTPKGVAPGSLTITTADGTSSTRSIALRFEVESQVPTLSGYMAAGADAAGYEYLFGGLDLNWWIVPAAERYNPAAKEWLTLSPMSSSRVRVAAAELGGKIYLAGGSEYGYWPTDRFEVYDPESNTYAMLNPLPKTVEGAAMASLDGVLYLSGGFDSWSGATSSFYRYDSVSDSWVPLPPMMIERYNHRMISVKGKLYVMGGYHPMFGNLTSCEMYDPVSNTWSMRSDIPVWSSPLSVATDGIFIYILGGTEYWSRQVFKYDPDEDGVTEVPFTLPSAGGGPGAYLNGSLYVFGGANSFGKVMSLKTDFVPPAGAITINGGAASTVSPTVEIAISAADAYGVEGMRFSEDGISWTDWMPFMPTATYTFGGEGRKTLHAALRDTNGNVGIVKATILYDITPPNGTIAISEGDSVANTSTVIINVLATDAATEVKFMQFSNDGFTWSVWEPYAATRVWTLATGDGPRVVYARFMDAADNVSVVCSDTIVVDSTVPSGRIIINGGAGWTNALSVTLNLYAEATSGRITQMQLSTDTLNWTPWERFVSTRNFSVAAGDGEKRIYVRFRDVNGKVSPFYSDSIVLETVAPSGSVVINGNVTWTATSVVTLTLEGADNLSGVTHMQISSDNVTWGRWESFSAVRNGVSLQRGDGARSIYVRFRDAAGNVSPVYSDEIMVDLTLPTGSILINDGASQSNYQFVRLTIATRDEGSGIQAMQLSRNNVDWDDWQPPMTVIDPFYLEGANGMNYVYVRFRDQAGNISRVYSDSIRFIRLP